MDDFRSNKITFWKEVMRTRKGIGVKEECVKDVKGNVVTEKNEVCERWKEYFEDLLNMSERGTAEITSTVPPDRGFGRITGSRISGFFKFSDPAIRPDIR